MIELLILRMCFANFALFVGKCGFACLLFVMNCSSGHRQGSRTQSGQGQARLTHRSRQDRTKDQDFQGQLAHQSLRVV